jgi:hypothetical protein
MYFVYSSACPSDVSWEVAQRIAIARSSVLSRTFCCLLSTGSFPFVLSEASLSDSLIFDHNLTRDTVISNSIEVRQMSAFNLPWLGTPKLRGGQLCHVGRKVFLISSCICRNSRFPSILACSSTTHSFTSGSSSPVP